MGVGDSGDAKQVTSTTKTLKVSEQFRNSYAVHYLLFVQKAVTIKCSMCSVI